MLTNIRKTKGRARKNIAVALGTAGILLAAGMLFAGQEKQITFGRALAEATEPYYETEESQSLKYEEVEADLQRLQKEFTKDEETRRLLLLLAANAELQKEWERAAVYYEQLLLYAPEYAEGYGKYGLFLLRRGQSHSGRRLLALYKSSGADGTDCKSVEIWEKQMESLVGKEK